MKSLIRVNLDRGIEGVWLFFSLNRSRHKVLGWYGITWSGGFVGIMLTKPDPLPKPDLAE